MPRTGEEARASIFNYRATRGCVPYVLILLGFYHRAGRVPSPSVAEPLTGVITLERPVDDCFRLASDPQDG
jgi:hypothetical protein